MRLPFQFFEHPTVQWLVEFARKSPDPLTFPSTKTIRRRLCTTVSDRQKSLLAKLPPNAKISLALDCWTSPFQQPFMAVTGYFIDEGWNYREILLGFEPLHGAHSGEISVQSSLSSSKHTACSIGSWQLPLTTHQATKH